MKRYLNYMILSAIVLTGVFVVSFEQTNVAKNDLHVVLISMDGLRSDALTILGKERLPNYFFLLENGATTLNARTDDDSTVTIPNHTSMLTGRPLQGEQGHHYKQNEFRGKNLHKVRGEYVDSVFDVLHDHSFRTAFFASKNKFKLFLASYAASPSIGMKILHQNRSTKIDQYGVYEQGNEKTLAAFLDELTENHPNFTFLHFSNPDQAGHRHKTWDIRPGSAYMKAVQKTDEYLGKILETIRKDEKLKDSTILIVTSDHGGSGKNHKDIDDPDNYTVPFLVWGRGVAQGKDLYALNSFSRQDPGRGHVPYDKSSQPIRNADAANLVTSLFHLPAINHSLFNFKHDINISDN